jgi:starvation-inducible DNA-binding protein
MTTTENPTSAQTTFPGVVASPDLERNLQQVLVDLTALHLAGKHAHWNVVGANFRDLHLQLDELIDTAREHADTIAERMRALYAVPDGRPAIVAETTTLPPQPAGEIDTVAAANALADLARRTAATARRVHDAVDAEDPSTADLLHAVIVDLEKQAWLIGSETRRV